MTNINLLEGKDFSKEIDTTGQNLITSRHFQAPENKPEPPKIDVATPTTSSGEKKTVRKPPSSQPFAERSSFWPILAGIIAALAVIVFLIYLYTDYKGKDRTAKPPEKVLTDSVAVATKANETVPAGEEIKTPPATETSTTIPEETSVYSTSLEQGRRQAGNGAAILNELLSVLPAGIQLSFFRYDGNNYTLEAATSSPGLFDQLENNLASRKSALLPFSSSEHEVLLGSQVLTLRQINGKYQAAGEMPTTTGVLLPDRVRGELQGKARQFNFQLKEFNIAPRQAGTAKTFRPATLKLLGNQDQLVGFLQNLVGSFRNVGLNKILVSTPSLADLNNSQVNVVLDLDIYSE